MPRPGPLVGRDAELTTLTDLAHRCASGSGGVVLLSGEAGVGKSRLVLEVLGRWEGAVLHGRALPGGPAYGVLLRLCGDLRTGGADQTEAVLGALLAHGRNGPCLVHLEDCHVADSATLGLLARAEELLGDLPLLVVAEYRTDQLPRQHPLRALRAELRRRRRWAGITLAPFSAEQTRLLIEALLQGPAEPGLVEAVQRRSDGNPFFIEELMTGLVEGNGLERPGAHWGLAHNDALPLPDSLVDAVLARTADVRETHPEAVRYAAVLGSQVDLRALESLAGAFAVDQLLEAGLLVEFDGRIAAFRHGLVRDGLLGSVPWSLRRRLHREVAEVLQRQGSPPAQVAEHWAAAHENGRARALLVQAVEQHCAVHAFQDAVTAGLRALALWPSGEDDAGRLQTLEKVGECCEASGRYPTALAAWREAAVLHRHTGSTSEAAAAHCRAANAAEMLADVDATLQQRRLAAATYEEAGRRRPAAQERLALAQRLKAMGRFAPALEEARRASRLAELAGAVAVRVTASALEGATRSALGDGVRGIDIARSAVEEALAAGLEEASAEAVYELGEAFEYAAEYAAAAEAYAFAVDLCDRHGLQELGAICRACTTPVARLMGEWDRVLDVCTQVRADATTQLFARRVADEESGLVTALRGDARRARPGLRRAAAFGQENAVAGIEIGAVWGLAQVAVLEQDDAECRRLVDRLLELCSACDEGHYSLPALRWCASYLASIGEADQVARVHRAVADRSRGDAAPKVLSTLAHSAAELAGLKGDLDQAAALMARSLDLLSGMTAPYEVTVCTLRLGGLEARRGNRDAAVQQLTTAYRTARRLRARPLAREAAQELDGIGEPVERRLGRRAARETSGHGLTRRELEVLQHLARDRTNREIATRLFLSVRTVDMHVRHILEKLGCSTRAAAVRVATRERLVALDEEPGVRR